MPVLDINHELNTQLDLIIEARRSIRSFEPEVPPPELIKEVIKAGLLAPYAAQAVSSDERFRRFMVMKRGSEAMSKAEEMMRSRIKAMYELLAREIEINPDLRKKGDSFFKRLRSIAEGAEIGFESAPYFIVLAERKGFPPVELRSLAHCLQNMWLKCVPLGLGFRLISATTQMADDEEFCNLLGIPRGEFGLDGCAVGYPEKIPPPTRRPILEEVITWI